MPWSVDCQSLHPRALLPVRLPRARSRSDKESRRKQKPSAELAFKFAAPFHLVPRAPRPGDAACAALAPPPKLQRKSSYILIQRGKQSAPNPQRVETALRSRRGGGLTQRVLDLSPSGSEPLRREVLEELAMRRWVVSSPRSKRLQ